MIRHPLSPPGTGDEERWGLPDRWARSGPSLRRPHPRLASGRASGRQVWLPEPAPVNKPRADNRVPENKKPFQGTGPGGPHFQVHDLTSRKPSGAARAPHKAFDGLAWRPQITGPQASRARPTPHSVDKRPSPKGGTDGWDRRPGGSPDPTALSTWRAGQPSPLRSCSLGPSSPFALVRQLRQGHTRHPRLAASTHRVQPGAGAKGIRALSPDGRLVPVGRGTNKGSSGSIVDGTCQNSLACSSREALLSVSSQDTGWEPKPTQQKWSSDGQSSNAPCPRGMPCWLYSGRWGASLASPGTPGTGVQDWAHTPLTVPGLVTCHHSVHNSGGLPVIPHREGCAAGPMWVPRPLKMTLPCPLGNHPALAGGPRPCCLTLQDLSQPPALPPDLLHSLASAASQAPPRLLPPPPAARAAPRGSSGPPRTV